MAHPFPHDVHWALAPQGPFASFTTGTLECRVYRDAGHLEIVGPDLAGTAGANRIRFAPPAVATAHGVPSVGTLVSAEARADGLELRQKLGDVTIASRFWAPFDHVVRYEVLDWGGLMPLATACAAASPADEHFYGFGETFVAFDQAGQTVRIQTFDEPGPKQHRSYKVAPWFVSTRGYGLHLDSSAESVFDLRAGAPDRWVVTNPLPQLRVNVVYGPDPKDVVRRYTGYTGRPALPPPWAFGPWISSDVWRSGGEVRYAVTRFRALDLAASAFVFDSPWETAYNDFRFNASQFAQGATIDGESFDGFASIAEMMQFLQTQGLKVVCWLTPFVNVASVDEHVPGQNLGKAANYDDGAARHAFVRASAGGPPLVVPWWKGRGSPVDFTSPDARRWLQDQLWTLVDASRVTTASGGREPAIGGFKTDDGESSNGPNTYIPVSASYADGRTGVEMRNAYCREYHAAVSGVLAEQGILFSRSGFVGSQAFPASWAGDNEPNFGDNGLPSVIVAGQSAAMSGYAIWGHDVGGYQDVNFSSAPANLFMRWTQFGCFSPIMQMHRQVTTERQYPWRFGAAALANFRRFAQLHTQLFPYVYTYAQQASTMGLPIIRPLVLVHPSDPNTFALRHVYYFGDELLVAPMIHPNATSRQVYLPAGRWIDFWTNARHGGGGTITWTNADQTTFPLFVREGAVVPMLLRAAQTLCRNDYVANPAVPSADDGLLVKMYPGGTSDFTLYDGTSIECQASPGGVVVTVSSFPRDVMLEMLTADPGAVTRDGTAVPRFQHPADLADVASGWSSADGKTFVKMSHPGGESTVRF